MHAIFAVAQQQWMLGGSCGGPSQRGTENSGTRTALCGNSGECGGSEKKTGRVGQVPRAHLGPHAGVPHSFASPLPHRPWPCVSSTEAFFNWPYVETYW